MDQKTAVHQAGQIEEIEGKKTKGKVMMDSSAFP